MHAHHHARLEAEGELSLGVMQEAIALAARLLADAGSPVARVVDLGCGPGVGTAALARAFPAAAVLAVDVAPDMLDRAAARARSARVETRRLDLDGDLGSLGHCDLAWASMSIHHADDEVATLRAVRSLIAPGGLLCVLERADPLFVRFPDELGRPGLWDRLGAARRQWFEDRRDRLPGAMNADAYPAMLAAAGLDVVVDRALTGTVTVRRDAELLPFIASTLRQDGTQLAPFAAAADLAALERLLEDGPSSSDRRWDAVEVTTSRKLYIARPASRAS